MLNLISVSPQYLLLFHTAVEISVDGPLYMPGEKEYSLFLYDTRH